MADDGVEWPEELCVQPQALVGVLGLDVTSNQIHRTIWDALVSSRRQDRAPVHFKLLPPVHDFPPVKPKRNSYEWYIPKGILKKNWMKKHLTQLPAVVVVFFDLDWDDPQWGEKRLECTARVQSVRSALDGRNTRVAVVLLQQKAPLPTGEDVLTAERAATLCSASEINPKSLFVLPHGDHLPGYTLRLENAFYELAQSYYQAEIRHIKSHREHLNKMTHQYLFVRHQFKMGFLNEMRQDIRSANGHYSQAYTNLQELRMVDTNSLEVKTAAGFIVYKLCRLMFAMNQPRDAIQQFKVHIDYFQTKLGPRELMFEHHAWLAKQFSMFGDLFDEAIRLGLPAVQTRHPGFYYEQAARHAVNRKFSCLELCLEVDKYPENDPLVGYENLEFYGQRPWRPGKLSVEPPDAQREIEGIRALQYKEKFNCNHSMIIITLIGNAISQFKTYRCPRMRRHLVIQMAEEYCSSRDYGKALTLISHMLWDYRSERWHQLLASLLSRALTCAFLTASVNEYIELALESMAQLPENRQIQVFNNLLAIIKCTVPEPEPGISEEEIPIAVELWKTRNMNVGSPITVEMNNITSCFECKAKFIEATCTSVEIQVLIRSQLPCNVQFSRLSVCVNNPTVSSEFAVCGKDDANDPKLLFSPGEIKTYFCHFVPDPQDIGKEIQIGSILLELGGNDADNRRVLLQFTGQGNEASIPFPELLHFRYSPADSANFDTFRPVVSTVIAARIPLIQLNVDQQLPSLQGSWHQITVVVNNTETITINQAVLHVSIRPSSEDATIEQSTEICESIEAGLLSLPLTLTLGSMPAGQTSQKTFFMKSNSLATRNLILKVSYRTDLNELCEKEEVVSVPVAKALDISSSFLSTRFEVINKLFNKEPFLICMQINCISPLPIVVKDTQMILGEGMSDKGSEYACQLKGTSLKQEESGTCIASLTAEEPSSQPISIGSFVINWKREGTSDSLITTLTVPLPFMCINESPLLLNMKLPAHGWVRTPLPVSYIVQNNTSNLLNISLNMEPSDAFMFAGHKQQTFGRKRSVNLKMVTSVT
ncbi:trafficking protein particle complex subunit 11 gry isoform X2 [Lycorma delicatula]|uniref:trafficking protein particle complex subunit 11 gry isoform X2 n=1 Tax=Lycorma delicatula TaxID=130591 RepID=UPI003F5122EB